VVVVVLFVPSGISQLVAVICAAAAAAGNAAFAIDCAVLIEEPLNLQVLVN
jgi:hypothetical protein